MSEILEVDYDEKLVTEFPQQAPSGNHMVAKIYREQVEKGVVDYVERTVALMGDTAVKGALRLNKLVDSSDQNVALKASIYGIDRVLGKPTQKTLSRVERVNIDVVAG